MWQFTVGVLPWLLLGSVLAELILVFVFYANVLGDANLDAVCAHEGLYSGFPGLGTGHSYAALACTPAHPSVDMLLASNTPIVSVSGQLLAEEKKLWLAGSRLFPSTSPLPYLNGKGNAPSNFVWWSGCSTRAGVARRASSDCSGFTSTAGQGAYAVASQNNGFYTSTTACNTRRKVICVRDPVNFPQAPSAVSPVSVVFPSQSTLFGDQDLDRVCASEGGDTSHPLLGPSHSYAALVANHRHSDLTRLLPPGYAVADLELTLLATDKENWFGPSLFGASLPSPFGQNPLASSTALWTGVSGDDAATPNANFAGGTCANFTAYGGGGAYGTGAAGFYVSTTGCTTRRNVLCVRDPYQHGLWPANVSASVVFATKSLLAGNNDFDLACASEGGRALKSFACRPF